MHMLDISSCELQHVREQTLCMYPVKLTNALSLNVEKCNRSFQKNTIPIPEKIPMGACIEQAALEGTRPPHVQRSSMYVCKYMYVLTCT